MDSSSPLSNHKYTAVSGIAVVGYFIAIGIGHYRGRQFNWREASSVVSVSAAFALIAEFSTRQKGTDKAPPRPELLPGSNEHNCLTELLNADNAGAVSAILAREKANLPRLQDILRRAAGSTEHLDALVDGASDDVTLIPALIEGCPNDPQRGMAIIARLVSKRGHPSKEVQAAAQAMINQISYFTDTLFKEENRETLNSIVKAVTSPGYAEEGHPNILIAAIPSNNPTAMVQIALTCPPLTMAQVVKRLNLEKRRELLATLLSDPKANKEKIESVLPSLGDLKAILSEEPLNSLKPLTTLLTFAEVLGEPAKSDLKEAARAALARFDPQAVRDQRDLPTPETAHHLIKALGCSKELTRYIQALANDLEALGQGADAALVEALLCALFADQTPLGEIPDLDLLLEQLKNSKLPFATQVGREWMRTLQRRLDREKVSPPDLIHLAPLAAKLAIVLPEAPLDHRLAEPFNQLSEEESTARIADAPAKVLCAYLHADELHVKWLMKAISSEQLEMMLIQCEGSAENLAIILNALREDRDAVKIDTLLNWFGSHTQKLVPILNESIMGPLLDELGDKRHAERYKAFAQGIIESGKLLWIQWLVEVSSKEQFETLMASCKNAKQQALVVPAALLLEKYEEKAKIVAKFFSSRNTSELEALLGYTSMQPRVVSRLNAANPFWSAEHKVVFADKLKDLLREFNFRDGKFNLHTINDHSIFGVEEMSHFPPEAAASHHFVDYVLMLEKPGFGEAYSAALTTLFRAALEVKESSASGGFFSFWSSAPPPEYYVNSQLDKVVTHLLACDPANMPLSTEGPLNWKAQLSSLAESPQVLTSPEMQENVINLNLKCAGS